ncbi:MAG: SDR family NAD(P)-dependent oxidoreductase [Fimbriimonadaceae bacterium]
MKQVLITGASSGIGAELAILLAEHGYELVLTARREHLLKELAVRCEEMGALRVGVMAGDIEEVARNPQILDLLKGEGEVVLVNNAGFAEFGDYSSSELEANEVQMAKNLLAPMAMTRAVLPLMLEAKRGLVVNVLSVAARSVFPGAAVYSASKAGLMQFGTVIREEYRRHGIRVTNVLPGATDTPIWGADAAVGPPREKMLRAKAVAEAIAGVVAMPGDRVVEELVITPPDGVL